MLKVGSIIQGECTSYSNEGEGVIHFLKNVIFVKGLFQDEKAEIEILYHRAGIYYGKIKKLINISKHRIKPRCSISTSCGGCVFQALDYPSQLIYKKEKIIDTFKHIANIDTNVNNCIGMDYPYYYRNKAQVPIKRINKKIVAGFYQNKSHRIIECDECFVENKKSNEIIKSIKKIMNDFNIEPYDEDHRKGIIRHILVRTSYHYDELMVVLVTNVDVFPSMRNFVKALVKQNPYITTIVQNINKRDTNVILGEIERVLFGKGFIIDSLCGINFRISSKSFFQINPIQTEKLYRYITNNLSLNKTDILLDAYCGVGTIGMCLSDKVKEVIGVEINQDAIKDAIKNAKSNNINNIKFICDDAERYIYQLEKIDCLVMDPPRKGSTIKFLNAINKVLPRNIIYVSCDPNTLARDLITLKKKYNIISVQPFDMFPFTYHVETVVLLSRK